jgi:8-oxo-dGTP pyrophosphatase MutT (NUDIX family)
MRAWWRVRRPLSVGVRVLLVRDGQVLLVRHTYLHSWFAPGGGVERGETLEEAIRREAREEVGATLHDLRLMGIYTSFKESKSDHVVMFVSTDFSVDGTSDREIEEFRWYPLDALPDDLSPATARRIEDYLAGRAPGVGDW